MYTQLLLVKYRSTLTPYHRERGKYYCPACGGHNLSFSRSGAWNCWNNPSYEHRIEILKAVIPDFKQIPPRSRPPPPFPVKLPIHPAQIHFPLIMDKRLTEVVGNRSTYWYSSRQRIIRLDYPNRKVIFPQSLSGKYWQNSAGSEPWVVFGLSRLLPYPGMINLVLVVEGQKCVEIAHQRGIPALCLEGGDYSHQTTFHKLREIRDKLERLVLAILPDYDLAGNQKSIQIAQIANYLSIPAFILHPLEIEAALSVGDDIEQLTNFNKHEMMRVAKLRIATRTHFCLLNLSPN
jgi:hypothetical protein